MSVNPRRFRAFATVGAFGFVLQLATLSFLTSIANWTWLPATIVAVETAVIHNYLWHERWTWKERSGGTALSVDRLARFHIANALSSIVGNLVLMWLFVSAMEMAPVVANVFAVGVMSAVNFIVADRWVFGAAAAVLLAAPRPVAAAPPAATLTAWEQYVARTEAHLETTVGGTHDVVRDVTATGQSIGVPGGTISHWRGSVFIAGTTAARVLDRLMHPGTPPPQEDIVSSRVLSRGEESLHVYIRLVRHAIVTVSYDTEHEMRFQRRSSTIATARSVATRIEEVGGTDHGFLWRLHSYWRYEQTKDGVLVELESLTLSRDVPVVVRTVASPLVNRIARESIHRTLDALRRQFTIQS
jgi:putative flippase GtrA